MPSAGQGCESMLREGGSDSSRCDEGGELNEAAWKGPVDTRGQ